MNVRRFRALHAAGAGYAEIGRECGCDWRTVKKYLAEDAPSVPPTAPRQPYLVTDKHLRRVGKDALVSFQASFYSVPARRIRPGQRVQLAVEPDTVTIRALGVDGGGWLATHPRARQRGSWVVDPTHWDGLPDGHTRAVSVDPAPLPGHRTDPVATATAEPSPLTALLAVHHAATAPVSRRPLTDYHTAGQAIADRAGTTSTTTGRN